MMLSKEERRICVRISKEKDLNGLRAQALVAVDDGASQVEAAASSGLTVGQVRYWLRKYRSDGLAAFPSSLLHEIEQTKVKPGKKSKKDKKRSKKSAPGKRRDSKAKGKAKSKGKKSGKKSGSKKKKSKKKSGKKKKK